MKELFTLIDILSHFEHLAKVWSLECMYICMFSTFLHPLNPWLCEILNMIKIMIILFNRNLRKIPYLTIEVYCSIVSAEPYMLPHGHTSNGQ